MMSLERAKASVWLLDRFHDQNGMLLEEFAHAPFDASLLAHIVHDEDRYTVLRSNNTTEVLVTEGLF